MPPALPCEITDRMIDQLHSDLGVLGICSTVCSEWLVRSRYHIFSTVQLWPWRANRFFDLAKSRRCTFTHHIQRVEFDDSRKKESFDSVRTTFRGSDEKVLFNEAMAQSHILCSQVRSMQLKNVNWTTLTPTEQERLRERLARFSRLDRLEFQGVIFHDLREVIRVVSSFPSLRQLSAHISFLKYLEYTIASAWTLRLPSNVHTIELGTDGGIPVMLSCLGGNKGKSHVSTLKLQNIKCSHLQYVSTILERSDSLQHVSLGFAPETQQTNGLNDFVNGLNLSRLSQLQTLCIEGLRIHGRKSPFEMAATLMPILQRIESSFLESINLRFLLDANAALAFVNWKSLESVLLMHHFFGLRFVRIVIVLEDTSTAEQSEFIERWIRRAMSDLNSREVLAVRVI